MTLRYNHIFFDYDSTLSSAGGLSRKTLEHVFHKVLSRFAPIAQFKTLTGYTAKQKLYILNRKNGEELYREWNKYFIENYEKYVRTYPHILVMLQKLIYHGAHIYILSNKLQRLLMMGFSKTGLTNYISEIFGVDRLGYAKPHKKSLTQLLDSLNLKLKECFYIGDSIIDHKLAKKVEITFGVALWDSKSRKDFLKIKENVVSFQTPSEITNYLIS